MTIEELVTEFSVDLSTLGPPNKRYIKIVIASEKYAPCFVGKGRTVQQAIDNAMEKVQHVSST